MQSVEEPNAEYLQIRSQKITAEKKNRHTALKKIYNSTSVLDDSISILK